MSTCERGWVSDSIPPPPSSGGSHVVYTVFLHHMTCRFFFFLNPPLPVRAAFLPGRKGKTAVAVPSSSPINRGIMQAGNSNKMQMSGRARLRPNSSLLTKKEKKERKQERNLPGASRPQPNPAPSLAPSPATSKRSNSLLPRK